MVERPLEISAKELAEVVAHCLQEAPNEACGILSGQGRRVRRTWPVPNQLASPTGYLMAPEAQLAAMRQVWAAGEELVAIYHSHPETPARPSPRDVAQAFHREAVYLIVSLSPRLDIRAYTMEEQGRDPIELELRISACGAERGTEDSDRDHGERPETGG
ncbi:MAG: M67 family metallopeptidase [Methanocella sp.]